MEPLRNEIRYPLDGIIFKKKNGASEGRKRTSAVGRVGGRSRGIESIERTRMAPCAGPARENNWKVVKYSMQYLGAAGDGDGQLGGGGEESCDL